MTLINCIRKYFVETSDFTTLWTKCGDADNMYILKLSSGVTSSHFTTKIVAFTLQ